MAMQAKGLAKLIEETGELIKEIGELQQIAGKKLQYFYTDEHPDGQGSLKTRMEDEIADVMAICTFVIDSFDLSTARIAERKASKLKQYTDWDKSTD